MFYLYYHYLTLVICSHTLVRPIKSLKTIEKCVCGSIFIFGFWKTSNTSKTMLPIVLSYVGAISIV